MNPVWKPPVVKEIGELEVGSKAKHFGAIYTVLGRVEAGDYIRAQNGTNVVLFDPHTRVTSLDA